MNKSGVGGKAGREQHTQSPVAARDEARAELEDTSQVMPTGRIRGLN